MARYFTRVISPLTCLGSPWASVKKKITLFTFSAFGIIGVEVTNQEHTFIEVQNGHVEYRSINADSLINKAKKINEDLKLNNNKNAVKARDRLIKIKKDSVKKEKVIKVQKSNIKSLKKENTNLNIQNKKLNNKIAYLTAPKEEVKPFKEPKKKRIWEKVKGLLTNN